MKAEDFADQTEAEKKLIAHLREGKAGYCQIGDKLPTANAQKNLHIRASLIRALALNQVEDVPLPERGLAVCAAFIQSDSQQGGGTRGLNLEGTDVVQTLGLKDCYFPDLILLRHARMRNFWLDYSYLSAGLEADGAEISGIISMCNISSNGEIRLLGAIVGGDLPCSDAVLRGSSFSLVADNLAVKGSIFLDGISAMGEVRFVSAQIGGNLFCDSASLMARGTSLNCAGAKVGGGWFWRMGASAVGALDLTTAEIATIVDDPSCWPQELLLDRCRYGGFVGMGLSGRERIDWLSRLNPEKHHCGFWPQPYEECARALREGGYSADAREVLIQKERLQRAARDKRLEREIKAEKRLYPRLGLWLQRWLSRGGDIFLAMTVAYGRRPLQAVVPLLGILLLGSIIFLVAAGLDQIKPNLPQIQRAAEWTGCRPPEGSVPPGERWEEGDSQVACFLRQPEAASYPRFDALIYSA
ncbi:MAG: hypothetical protein ACK46Q_16070, partial [Hyphomonas sp.]